MFVFGVGLVVCVTKFFVGGVAAAGCFLFSRNWFIKEEVDAEGCWACCTGLGEPEEFPVVFLCNVARSGAETGCPVFAWAAWGFEAGAAELEDPVGVLVKVALSVGTAGVVAEGDDAGVDAVEDEDPVGVLVNC